jgi:hypothetical protein
MEVVVKAIEFPAPGMAIEDGTAIVTAKAGPPTASQYTAIHVLENGKWLMASVRERALPVASNFHRLKELDWLIGTWESKREGTTVRVNFRWIANKSFIEREYAVRQDGVETAKGIQIIGWDPQAGQVRSWSFDSLGGYGSSLWAPSPEGWRSASSGVLADGTPTSSREILIRVAGEDQVLGWRSVDRSIGGVALPDTPEVVLDRLPEER